MTCQTLVEDLLGRKVQENPLYAVMTTPKMVDAGTENFSPKHLNAFFGKGAALFDWHVAPLLAAAGD